MTKPRKQKKIKLQTQRGYTQYSSFLTFYIVETMSLVN